MTAELTVLGLAVLWAVVQLFLFAVPANREIGTKWTLGPRDSEQPPVSNTTGRLKRAFDNYVEAMVLYTAAAVVVVASGLNSDLTAWCAWAFLVARIVYVFIYWAGIAVWRTVVWMIGLGATVLMVLAALLDI